jgi:hypothetical protein
MSRFTSEKNNVNLQGKFRGNFFFFQKNDYIYPFNHLWKNRKNSLEVTTRVSESFETDKEIGPAVL